MPTDEAICQCTQSCAWMCRVGNIGLFVYVLASAVALASVHERIAVLAVLPYASAQCDRFFAVDSREESEGLQGDGGPGKTSLAKVVVCDAKQAAEVGWIVADLSFVQLGSPFLSAAGGDPGGGDMGTLHLAVLVVAQERTGLASSDETGSILKYMHACVHMYLPLCLLTMYMSICHALEKGYKRTRAHAPANIHTHIRTNRHRACPCTHPYTARVHAYTKTLWPKACILGP